MSRISPEALEAALHTIYDAAMDHDAWPSALIRMGEVLETATPMIVLNPGTAAGDFIIVDHQRPLIELLSSDRRWLSQLFTTSPRRMPIERSEADAADVRITHLNSMLTKRTGFGSQISHSLRLDDGDRAELVILRKPGASRLSPEDMALLGSLARAARQALRLSLRVTRTISNEIALRAALDAADASIHIVDGTGRVHFSNARARARSDVYVVNEGGQLTPRVERDRPGFLALLQAYADGRDGSMRRAILITAGDGAQHVLWGLPIPSDAEPRAPRGADTRILLFTTPVRRENTIDPHMLRNLFELALGQARLAALVGGGLELRAAADRLGVTEGTARIVLKRVFRKLRINRQVELALLLSSLTQFSPIDATSDKSPRE